MCSRFFGVIVVGVQEKTHKRKKMKQKRKRQQHNTKITQHTESYEKHTTKLKNSDAHVFLL